MARCLPFTFVIMAVLADSLGAIVARITPLKDVLASEQFIVMAQVESIDAHRSSATLVVVEDLKGKRPFSRARLRLDGDTVAQREKQAVKLLERIADKSELILFGSRRGQQTTLFAYTNGTWFQIVGSDADANLVSFTHLEPYLRRTFKGSTAELKHVVIDGLSGKKPPPPPDPNEPPGLGPVPANRRGGE